MGMGGLQFVGGLQFCGGDADSCVGLSTILFDDVSRPPARSPPSVFVFRLDEMYGWRPSKWKHQPPSIESRRESFSARIHEPLMHQTS